jgi:hypothetical protein
VEDAATLERVRALGIDVALGDLLGRPAPFEPTAAARPAPVA